MNSPEARKYLEAQVRTANKEQLMLMLFDGAIRFSNQAKDALQRSDFETSHHSLNRTQSILLELICSMDKSMDKEIYNNLCGLYKFAYFRLVEASLKREVGLIDEALKVLNSLRETWAIAIEERQKETVEAPLLATGIEDGKTRINVEG